MPRDLRRIAAGDGDDGVAVLSRAPITSAQVLTLPYFDVHVNSGRRVALASADFLPSMRGAGMSALASKG